MAIMASVLQNEKRKLCELDYGHFATELDRVYCI